MPFGLLFMGIAGWVFANDQDIAENGISAQGKVIDLTRARDSDGEDVEIIYPPNEPGRAIIDGFADRFFLLLIFGLIGSIFALIGAGMLWSYFRRKKIITGLRQNGLPIQAKFLESFCDTTSSVTGRNPFRVVCGAPATGKTQEFKSEAIWRKPSDLFKQGENICVLVDPSRPRNLFVDLTAQISGYPSD